MIVIGAGAFVYYLGLFDYGKIDNLEASKEDLLVSEAIDKKDLIICQKIEDSEQKKIC